MNNQPFYNFRRCQRELSDCPTQYVKLSLKNTFKFQFSAILVLNCYSLLFLPVILYIKCKMYSTTFCPKTRTFQPNILLLQIQIKFLWSCNLESFISLFSLISTFSLFSSMLAIPYILVINNAFNPSTLGRVKILPTLKFSHFLVD